MILDYYNLREQPFGVTPDSRYLFASSTHREALASLLYGIDSGRGFVALIAKPGMGKTTLLFEALERLRGKARTAFLFQSISTPVELLRSLLADLGFPNAPGGLMELQAKLNEVLEQQARTGMPLAVFLDEAQNLNDQVLEMVRMLSNFETSREKVLQIVLSGQPQLARRLEGEDLLQLRQRISILARLEPFTLEETALYIDHRLRIAGRPDETPLFTKAAVRLIASESGGIPRNINNLCFNALSLGLASKRKTIDEEAVREVLSDLDLEPLRETKARAPELSILNVEQLTGGAQQGSDPMVRSGQHGRQRLKPSAARRIPAGAWAVIAAVLIAAILFAGTRFLRRQTSANAAIAQTASLPTPRIAPPSVPVLAAAEPSHAAVLDTVQVTPGDTLYQICIERLGIYNSSILASIRKLNPWLTNPDDLPSGRTIRIPARESGNQSQNFAEASGARLAGAGEMQ